MSVELEVITFDTGARLALPFTPISIRLLLADGSIRAIYLRNDGYAAYAGAILGGWYKTPEQVWLFLTLIT